MIKRTGMIKEGKKKGNTDMTARGPCRSGAWGNKKRGQF